MVKELEIKAKIFFLSLSQGSFLQPPPSHFSITSQPLLFSLISLRPSNVVIFFTQQNYVSIVLKIQQKHNFIFFNCLEHNKIIIPLLFLFSKQFTKLKHVFVVQVYNENVFLLCKVHQRKYNNRIMFSLQWNHGKKKHYENMLLLCNYQCTTKMCFRCVFFHSLLVVAHVAIVQLFRGKNVLSVFRTKKIFLVLILFLG